MNLSITKRGQGIKNVQKALDVLRRSDVLVGIPQANDDRPGEPIGNAGLLFIQSHGSPANNLPARPVLEPAIQADGNRQNIAAQLKEASKAAFEGNPTKVESFLRKAGIVAVNATKAWFFDARNNWLPLKPATIKRKGSSQPLIDTGALRKSITYVLRFKP